MRSTVAFFLAMLWGQTGIGPAGPAIAEIAPSPEFEAPERDAQPLGPTMLEPHGCIGSAPLKRVAIVGPWPDRIMSGSRPVSTPAFTLPLGGIALARIGEYVQQDHSYPVPAKMMLGAGIYLEQVR